MNSISPISFQGTIKIKSYEKSKSGVDLPVIDITPDQSHFIEQYVKHVADKMPRNDELPTPISDEDANFVYELLNIVTGRKFRNVDNQKVLRYSEGRIIFGDHSPQNCQGERMTIELDA